MPIDITWLWGDKALSDVTLLLFAEGDDGMSDMAAPHVKPAPLMELYLHRVVVMSVSQYFRDHLDRWAPVAVDQEQQPTKQSRLAEPAGQAASQQQQSHDLAASSSQLVQLWTWVHQLIRGSIRPVQSLPTQSRRVQQSASSISQLVYQSKRKGLQPSVSATQEPGTRPTRHASQVLRLTLFPGEPHAALEAVMHHAYCGHLPDDPTLLPWMVRRADYLLMPDTVSACMAQLSALSNAGKLTVPDVVLMQVLQAPHADPAMVQQMSQLIAKVLSLHFANAREVLLKEHLLEQFVQLPYVMLKHWGNLANIKVDSESTVALLLTAWYDHQLASAPAGSGPTEQQCKELSTMLRLDRLTPSFHIQAMPHLKWYRDPDTLPDQHGLVRMLCSLSGTTPVVSHKSAMEAGGLVGDREPVPAQQQWSFTREQLEQLWKDRALWLDGHMYFNGFNVTAKLCLLAPGTQSDSTEGPCTLGIFFTASWPDVLVNHGVADKVRNPVVALSCEVAFGPNVTLAAKSAVLMADKTLGWNAVAKRTFSCVDDLMKSMNEQGSMKVTLSKPF